jgi:hypothetical protein
MFYIEEPCPLGQIGVNRLCLGILYLQIGKRNEKMGNQRLARININIFLIPIFYLIKIIDCLSYVETFEKR